MRLDVFLTDNDFFDSRNKAKTAIDSGRVTVNGKVVSKASYEVDEKDEVELIKSDEYEFVGRGGLKLEHALSAFNVSVSDKLCVDIGASTGGFTECLLLHGAKRVYAIDSGKGQLAKKLLCDERVISIEGFNARNLNCDDIEQNLSEIIVMDVSFISQKLLYPAILRVADKGCDVITLIKPQFEAGRQNLGKNGIVKDKKVRQRVVDDIIEYAQGLGFEYIAHSESPITGGDGNIEYLLHLKVK